MSTAQSTSTDLPSALRSIWTSHGLPEGFLHNLKLIGDPDNAVPSSFRLGLAAQISIGLSGLSAAYVHYLRTGIEQDVVVDARHAVLSFHSEAWYTINDTFQEGDVWDSIAGQYPTKNEEWVRIHTNFPHHRTGILSILSIPDHPTPATRSDVARTLEKWDATEFEDECGRQGMCAFKLRTREEWDETMQGKVVKGYNVVDVTKVGEAPKKIIDKECMRPLDGVKALDLSRVLAGPVAGRALAALGAQTLLITSPCLPSLPLLDVETSLGKRTTQLDLTSTQDADKLEKLVQGADVFLQAYRPGGIAGRGFGVDDVIKIRSESRDGGVVYASLRAWGWDGPWADRRGFDSLVQTATGFNADEGTAFQAFMASQGKGTQWVPKPLPMQALDHAAGYLLAFGINVALARMITKGGSHEVRVSLAGVGQWVRSLGRIDPLKAFGPAAQAFPKRTWPLQGELAALSTTWVERQGKDGGQGRRMTALRQPAVLGVTPVREGAMPAGSDWGAPMRLDADDPVWVV
ncbi:hypothetical protein GALMADRAFT_237704 [Galerina marginata CBS 339.88]|uniref:CoA-transferase family III n=1 Tax=Galerina marginata (strain CBS 339.88) TaxID=685588 RepID=A0A067TR72_GALM3|nr:hypothetical protein GALMADRAFT_237704 [Galerina marginata CBS 339.88]